jgi:hypothetical protein
LVIPAGLVALVLAPTLLFPYGRDQSVFAYVGSVIARGGMPYRDAWDLKPPGIYLLYAFLASLCPDDGKYLMLWVRAADVGIAAATGVLLTLLARRWGREETGWAAAAWYAALYLHGGHWHRGFWSMAQAEAWANPLALGAIYCGLRIADDCSARGGLRNPASPGPQGSGSTSGVLAEAGAVSSGGPGSELVDAGKVSPSLEQSVSQSAIRNPQSAILMGALTGAVAVLKFTAVLPILPFLALAVCAGEGNKLRRLLLIGAGCAVPLVLTLAWLVNGRVLDDYLEIQRQFVAPYARLDAPGLEKRVANLFGYTLGLAAQLWLPVALAVLGGWKGAGWKAPGRGLALAMLAAGLAAVWAQNKYFGYHWQTVLPALALLAAAGGADLLRRARLPARMVPVAGVAIALGWSLTGHWSDYRDSARLAVGGVTREAWLARFGAPGSGDFSFLADQQAAMYVRQTTQPGDAVLVWGFEPTVYLLAERQAPTRFFFNVPLTVRFAPERWRKEFLSDLRARPPELFLVVRSDAIPWASGRNDDSVAQLAEWKELQSWLLANYREETQIEDFTIYRQQQQPTDR